MARDSLVGASRRLIARHGREFTLKNVYMQFVEETTEGYGTPVPQYNRIPANETRVGVFERLGDATYVRGAVGVYEAGTEATLWIPDDYRAYGLPTSVPEDERRDDGNDPSRDLWDQTEVTDDLNGETFTVRDSVNEDNGTQRCQLEIKS